MSERDQAGIFFARTGEPKWQTLADHLDNVSTLAEEFAGEFSERAWGTWLGRLHDIGKYSMEFQRRLRDPHARVDHSTAGAVEIIKQIAARTSQSAVGQLHERWLSRMAAGILAGHHGGLPHLAGDFDRRRRKYAHDYSQWEKEITLPHELPPFDRSGMSSIALLKYFVTFRTRMLFSCLVDADRLDAEAFSSPDTSAGRGKYPSIRELHDIFMEYMAGKTDPDAPADSVNSIRNKVLDDALRAAGMDPGLFRLTVPTGGGKTLSSLAFAMRHACLHGQRRIIYVIPYTSIIEQTADVFRAALGGANANAIVEHHSNYSPPNHAGNDPENPDELNPPAWENWDAPIIITTAVQFFESLHAASASSARKIHNIVNAVVVLDETQTLPLPLLRPCIRALDELTRFYRASVVLCTATQPEFSVSSWLPEGLDAEKVREINSDVSGSFTRLKRVTVDMAGTLDSATLADRVASHGQALCIVNTRAQAREVYTELAKRGEERNGGGTTGLWHLSTRMHPQHRRTVIRRVKESLSAREKCLVVSTQLVEAGVDLDFPVVYRCIAGLDSIAQAAGRCNREGRLENGFVHVFASEAHAPVDETDAGLAHSILSLPENAMRDPLAPDIMREYFKKRYLLRQKEGLDRKGILEHIDRCCPEIDFPRIEKDFRFIDDDGQAVILPVEIDAGGRAPVADGQSTVGELVRSLRKCLADEFVPRTLLRRLQPFTVSLRKREFDALAASGAVECLGKDGSFCVLLNSDLYSPETGLAVDDPTAMRSESLIV